MLVWETKTLMPASLHGWGGRSNGSAGLRRPTDLRREDSAERRMCPGPGGCQHVRMPQHRPDSRFAADVDYTGRAGHHDYVVRARHRLLDTTFTVVIDGVEHDPKAEEKARKAREKEEAGKVADRTDEDGHESPADDDAAGGEVAADCSATVGPADEDEPGSDRGSNPGRQGEDDLRFTLEDGFSTLRC